MMVIKKWWATLSLREQKILTIGGMIAAILLGYFIIWLPLNTAIAEKKILRATAQTTLMWMQQADARLQQLQATGSQHEMSTRPLFIRIQEIFEAQSMPDKPSELTEIAVNKVRLQFETVGFDALMMLLAQLWEKEGVVVEKLNIIKTTMPGVIQADITLTAPSSAQKYTS